MSYADSDYKSEPVELAEFTLPITLSEYILHYYDRSDFYSKFLSDKIAERNITISPWVKMISTGSPVYERLVKRSHPVPIHMTWLPSELRVETTQTMTRDNSNNKYFLIERSTVRGIPHADPQVIISWSICKSGKGVKCSTSLHFEYETNTKLRAAIESNTFVELTKYFKLYKSNANKYVHTIFQSQYKPQLLIEFFADEDNSYKNVLVDHTELPLESFNELLEVEPSSVNVDTVETVLSNKKSESVFMFNAPESIPLSEDEYHLIFSITYDDLTDILNLFFDTLVIDYEEVLGQELYSDNSLLLRKAGKICLLSSIVTAENMNWCPEDLRAWSYAKLLLFLTAYMLFSVVVLQVLRSYLKQKNDKSIIFNAIEISANGRVAS